jgi:hypothetical protein
VSMINIAEIRQVLMGSLNARIISLRDDVPLIAQHAIVDLAMAQAEAQDTGLMLDTIGRAPRPAGQQIALADLPSGIGRQHGILILSPGAPLGFRDSVVGPAELKPLSPPEEAVETHARAPYPGAKYQSRLILVLLETSPGMGASNRHPWAAHASSRGASSTSRTFHPRVSALKGFCTKAGLSSGTPWRRMASSV